MRILVGMQPTSSADLGRVPPRQRRRLAVLLLPVAAVLLIAGILLAWRAGSTAGHLAGMVLTLLALLLLGVGQGLLLSARRDEREQRLDEAILATAGACGATCDGEPGGAGPCGTADCAVRTLPRG